MASLESFYELSYPQEQLLRKGFYVGSLGLVTLSVHRENYTFHSRLGENEPGASFPLFLSSWQSYKASEWGLKVKRANDGVFSFALDFFPKSLKNLTSTFKYRQEKGSTRPSLHANYSTDNLVVNSELTFGSLSSNFTIGTPSYGLGLETDLDFNNEKVKAKISTLALYWFKDSARFLLKHFTVDSNPWSLGKVEAGLHQKIDEKLTLAGKVKSNWIDKATEVEVVAEFKNDQQNTFKAKATSNGKLDFVWKNYLSNNIEANFSAETSTDQLFAHALHDVKFGFRLNINQ